MKRPPFLAQHWQRQQQQQQGLSLLAAALWSAALAIVVIGGLFSMRYERNVFFDGINKFLGTNADLVQESQNVAAQAQSAVTGKAVPPKLDGKMYKCKNKGQTVYSNLPCEGSGGEITLHDNSVAAPPKPVAAEKAPLNATDRAVERATR